MASTVLSLAGQPDQAEALRSRTVAAYAATAGPTVILGLPFSVYLPPYIAEGGVISVALVGLLFSLTTIWDGVVDPLIGTMVDRVRTGLGAHRRWMLPKRAPKSWPLPRGPLPLPPTARLPVMRRAARALPSRSSWPICRKAMRL